MSNLYNSEPPTSGKVVLKTTLGDFDIELWPKEAPKATRNFVQLCLEGYYDGTIFHRVLENFIAQAGDPTGTGSGGESIYGAPFKDEFHSRLRFIHRGLVACANENRPHSNGSQFFFTLDKCEQLNRKHTIFGTITGESIYNLAPLSQLETDGDDRPKAPAVITGAEVIWNPFEDMVPRTTPEEKLAIAAAQKAAEQQALKLQRAQRKAQKGLLSFAEDGSDGEEEGAVEAPAQPETSRPVSMRSAHDAIADARLLQDNTEEAQALAASEAARDEERRRAQAAVRQALSRKKEVEPQAVANGRDAPLDDTEDFSARMRNAAVAKRRAMEPAAKADVKKRALGPGENSRSGSDRDSDDGGGSDSEGEKVGLLEQRRQQQLAALKGARLATVKPSSQPQMQDTSLMSEHQRRLAELKQQRKMTAGNAAQLRNRLEAFKQRLRSEQAAAQAGAEAGDSGADGADEGQAPVAKAAPQQAYAGKVRDDIDHEMLKPAAWRADSYLEGEDEADNASLSSLVRGGLRFAKGPAANDTMARTEDVDDYSVYDPMARGAPQPQDRPADHWRDSKRGRDSRGGGSGDRPPPGEDRHGGSRRQQDPSQHGDDRHRRPSHRDDRPSHRDDRPHSHRHRHDGARRPHRS